MCVATVYSLYQRTDSRPRRQLTLAMLDGREVLGTGLGLGAFKLRRLASPESKPAPAGRAAPGANKLLGRAGFFTAGFAAAGGGGGGAWAMMVMVLGRTNIPYPMAQSKYRSSLTLPSFFPVGSSSSTPIQSPGAKSVWPKKRMRPLRPSGNWTVWPAASSDMVG